LITTSFYEPLRSLQGTETKELDSGKKGTKAEFSEILKMVKKSGNARGLTGAGGR